jgi:hypothetical protein
MKTNVIVALAIGLGVSALAPAAHADPPKNSKDYAYDFGDDKLLGTEGSGTVPLIKVRNKVIRDMLHRPRLHFVPEMLKSVENM